MKLTEPSSKKLYWLQWLTILLAAFAFLDYLGYLPVYSPSDEARRALIATEMIISKDYITPTINGNLYFLKPPLYNWIIALSFKLFGSYSSFALRFPVIVSAFLFSFIIYHFVKKYTGNKAAAYVTAFTFLTNGRTLFYDSLQGLIDTTFSMLIYLSFMLVYHFGSQKKWLLLFIGTYILTAITFLMKGLPALTAQALTLLAYFIYTRQFKRLFYWQHFTGILIFFILTGSYYAAYFARNDVAYTTVFGNIFNESVKRTAVQYGWLRTVQHFFTFPFELIYHFAPWLFLFVVLVRKKFWQLIKSHPFIYFNAIIFLVNIFVYWMSAEVYARYLFMFLPLLLTILVWTYYEHTPAQDIKRKIAEYFFWFICIIATCTALTLPFLSSTKHLPAVWLKTFFVFIAGSLVIFYYKKIPAWRLQLFIIMLIICRMGFNWFVIHQRGSEAKYAEEKSKAIVKLAEGRPLYFYEMIGNADTYSFHIAAMRNEILREHKKIDKEGMYIFLQKNPQAAAYKKLLTFYIPFGADSAILVSPFADENAISELK